MRICERTCDDRSSSSRTPFRIQMVDVSAWSDLLCLGVVSCERTIFISSFVLLLCVAQLILFCVASFFSATPPEATKSSFHETATQTTVVVWPGVDIWFAYKLIVTAQRDVSCRRPLSHTHTHRQILAKHQTLLCDGMGSSTYSFIHSSAHRAHPPPHGMHTRLRHI